VRRSLLTPTLLRAPFGLGLLPGVLFAALSTGCGGSVKPERGPAYQPVATPETVSVCPEQWHAAKDAREAMLGLDSVQAKEHAAAAVLAQAECERRAIESGHFVGGTHAAVLAEVSALGDAHRNAQNLYDEVGHYGVARFEIAAPLGRGQLHLNMATRLSRIQMPTDMPDAGEQAAFRAEISSLVIHFRDRGEQDLRHCLAQIRAAPADQDWTERKTTACAQLATIGVSTETCGTR